MATASSFRIGKSISEGLLGFRYLDDSHSVVNNAVSLGWYTRLWIGSEIS